MSEPITWITKNGKHIPIYADKVSDDEQRKKKQIEQNEQSANDKSVDELVASVEKRFIDKDSWLYSDEYKKLQQKLKEEEEYVAELEQKEKELKDIIKKGSTITDETKKEMGKYAFMFPEKSPEAKKAEAELKELQEHFEIMKMGPELAKGKIKEFKQQVHKEEAEKFRNSEKTIGPAKDSYKYFRKDDTGVRDYQDLLKSGKAKIVEMSPREYLQRITYDIFGPRYDYTTLFENQFRIAQHDQSLKDILTAMKKGEKIYTPYLNYKDLEQEGRHRAVAAMLMGMDRIPVMIVR